jgi:hypothetical protein
MSRKHFVAIAEALAEQAVAFGSDIRHAHYVVDIANALAEFNPNFGYVRFMAAAGVADSDWDLNDDTGKAEVA